MKWLLSAVSALAIAVLPGVALAQAPASGGGRGGSGGSLGTGEVSLRVVQFGVDGKARPGSWFGLELEVTDRSDTLRDVLVQISLTDADGDRPQYRGHLLLNRNATQSIWLYAWLPYGATSGTTYTIATFDAKENGREEAPEALRYDAGELLAQFQYQVGGLVEPTSGMLAVVGPARGLALDEYQVRQPGESCLPTGHELTQIVAGLRPEVLPDRWMGLSAFDTIVWSGATAQTIPTNLTSEQAQAIREWIYRGGHLIAIIPPAGQVWIDAPANRLSDLMPDVTVQEESGVDLRDYWPLLMRRKRYDDITGRAPRPGQNQHWYENHVVHTFAPDPKATYGEARPLLNGPDGRCVVVQRLLGRGAVTLIGLDLTNGRLARADAVDPGVFWNRVLGRRNELFTPTEINAMQNATPPRANFRGIVRRYTYDDGISGLINMTGKAALGLLLAFVVFASYWLLAGPVAYLVLKQNRMKRHSWLAFVVAAVVFTGIAWGGATLFRPTRVEGRHLTLIDHVYGQPVQAARTWVTLLLPRYGEQRITVPDEDVGGVRMHNALTPWQPTGEAGSQERSSFPDARGYPIDSRSPNQMSVPTRATVKQFQIDWAGFSDLKMPRPVPPEGQSPLKLGSEIRLVPRAATGKQLPWTISGRLVHDLPSALDDVTFIVVERQPIQSAGGKLPVLTTTVSKTGKWEPGEVVDLGREFADADRSDVSSAEALFKDRLSARVGGATGLVSLTGDPLMGVAFFPLLEPPDFRSLTTSTRALYQRQATHGWDLARWFTQPCLIVVGRLDNSECPVPLAVGGADAKTMKRRIRSGRTYVRWIYPLPPDPPRIGPSSAPAASDASAGGEP